MSNLLRYHTFASSNSPSFPRQLITDPPDDWYGFSVPGNSSNCSRIKNISNPELDAVSYTSDGKLLNVTYWLTGPFNKNPSANSLISSPTYSMSIGLISDYRNLTIDYTVSIAWDPISGTWNKKIQELSSNDSRTLKTTANYTVSFDNTRPNRIVGSMNNNNNNSQPELTRGHLNLSLDLATINYPDRYFLIFGVSDLVVKKVGTGGIICAVFDISDNAVFIPSPRYTISALQGPITLRVNDEGVREVELNSSIPTAAEVSFSAVSNSNNGLMLKFDPENQNLTNVGLATSNLHLKVSENAIRSGDMVSYTIPIKATIYLPKIELRSPQNSTTSSAERSQSIELTQKISQKITTKPYLLTLTVLRKLNFQEMVSNIVKEWISPIKELWTFLVAVGALFVVIIRKYWKKQQKWTDY